jgi:hypothetical protein
MNRSSFFFLSQMLVCIRKLFTNETLFSLSMMAHRRIVSFLMLCVNGILLFKNGLYIVTQQYIKIWLEKCFSTNVCYVIYLIRCLVCFKCDEYVQKPLIFMSLNNIQLYSTTNKKCYYSWSNPSNNESKTQTRINQ